MMKDDNLHHVKTELNEYDELFLLYQKAHEVFHDVLTSDEDIDKESKRYCEHETTIRDFRRQTIERIDEAKRRLSDSLERPSHTSSKPSKRRITVTVPPSLLGPEKMPILLLYSSNVNNRCYS